MEILIFLVGVTLGIMGTMIYRSRERIHGIVHVDHETEQCLVNLSSEQLADRKKKIAVFYIDHEAKFSREEQGL